MFKHTRRAGDVSCSDDYPCCEILHCIHRRLINKRFSVAPEEEIQGIEVRGKWKTSNRSAESNPPPGICNIEMVTHRSRKICWCTIMHELHVLAHSGRYSLQQIRVTCCRKRRYFGPLRRSGRRYGPNR
ncbi:hypothetical protein AVEN_148667-1 [Araneus ventricosus]|uniref:Uncharacterized protein n=1 Tax=Araneus ventricosus TaxID=182803 RepID=A0A4Y2G9Q7_ARAVE|nr:hypothetical protein AVEN_148667-1 [Araneus ventricosus]